MHMKSAMWKVHIFDWFKSVVIVSLASNMVSTIILSSTVFNINNIKKFFLSTTQHIWIISKGSRDTGVMAFERFAFELSNKKCIKRDYILYWWEKNNIINISKIQEVSPRLIWRWKKMKSWCEVTHLKLIELLSIIQALDADLKALVVAFPPCSHSRTEALPGLQGADAGVVLSSEPCPCRGLQGAVGALDLTHSCSWCSLPPLSHTYTHPCLEEIKEQSKKLHNEIKSHSSYTGIDITAE